MALTPPLALEFLGHSTVAMALAVALVLVVSENSRPWAALGGLIYATAVGAGTVTAGWHRPSDVIGAYLVVTMWTGVTVAVLIWAEGAERIRPSRLVDRVPTLSPFLAGIGNTLLAYEADAMAAKSAGKPINIVYPTHNILIQSPAALTASGKANKGAKAFFAFLFSPAGQNLWAHNAFRPTLPSAIVKTAGLFPHVYSPKQLTTIASLKGWPVVTHKFFAPSTGIITSWRPPSSSRCSAC